MGGGAEGGHDASPPPRERDWVCGYLPRAPSEAEVLAKLERVVAVERGERHAAVRAVADAFGTVCDGQLAAARSEAAAARVEYSERGDALRKAHLARANDMLKTLSTCKSAVRAQKLRAEAACAQAEQISENLTAQLERAVRERVEGLRAADAAAEAAAREAREQTVRAVAAERKKSQQRVEQARNEERAAAEGRTADAVSAALTDAERRFAGVVDVTRRALEAQAELAQEARRELAARRHHARAATRAVAPAATSNAGARDLYRARAHLPIDSDDEEEAERHAVAEELLAAARCAPRSLAEAAAAEAETSQLAAGQRPRVASTAAVVGTSALRALRSLATDADQALVDADEAGGIGVGGETRPDSEGSSVVTDSSAAPATQMARTQNVASLWFPICPVPAPRRLMASAALSAWRLAARMSRDAEAAEAVGALRSRLEVAEGALDREQTAALLKTVRMSGDHARAQAAAAREFASVAAALAASRDAAVAKCEALGTHTHELAAELARQTAQRRSAEARVAARNALREARVGDLEALVATLSKALGAFETKVFELSGSKASEGEGGSEEESRRARARAFRGGVSASVAAGRSDVRALRSEVAAMQSDNDAMMGALSTLISDANSKISAAFQAGRSQRGWWKDALAARAAAEAAAGVAAAAAAALAAASAAVPADTAGFDLFDLDSQSTPHATGTDAMTPPWSRMLDGDTSAGPVAPPSDAYAASEQRPRDGTPAPPVNLRATRAPSDAHDAGSTPPTRDSDAQEGAGEHAAVLPTTARPSPLQRVYGSAEKRRRVRHALFDDTDGADTNATEHPLIATPLGASEASAQTLAAAAVLSKDDESDNIGTDYTHRPDLDLDQLAHLRLDADALFYKRAADIGYFKGLLAAATTANKEATERMERVRRNWF